MYLHSVEHSDCTDQYHIQNITIFHDNIQISVLWHVPLMYTSVIRIYLIIYLDFEMHHEST